MTELTRAEIKEVALRLAWASEVGGYINRLLDHDAALREKLAAVERERDHYRRERDVQADRCRQATQCIIEEVGARGVESLESALERLISLYNKAQAKLKQMEG